LGLLLSKTGSGGLCFSSARGCCSCGGLLLLLQGVGVCLCLGEVSRVEGVLGGAQVAAGRLELAFGVFEAPTEGLRADLDLIHLKRGAGERAGAGVFTLSCLIDPVDTPIPAIARTCYDRWTYAHREEQIYERVTHPGHPSILHHN